MANFVSWLLGRLPPRLVTGETERRFMLMVASSLDLLADGISYGVRARYLSDAPADALGLAGLDRQLERGFAESDESWRARLEQAWEVWPWAGTVHPDGLLGQLRAFGYDSATDPPYFVESQDTVPGIREAHWSQFWVVVPAGAHPYTSSIPAGHADAVRRILRAWRPANVVCRAVIFRVVGPLWDYGMPATWNDWEALAGTWDDWLSLSITEEG